MSSNRPARLALLGLLGLALLVLPAVVHADDDGVYHKIIYWVVGDPAPAFALNDDQAGVWKLSDHYPKKYVVLYFYMGDFMPACTRQARAYSNAYAALKAQGAEVVGISGDAVTNHQLFKEKNQLRQTLLADDKGDVGKAYGLAWSGGGEWEYTDDAGKTHKLTRGITESRWTWVIDLDGRVIYKNTAADPDQDAKQVLKFLTDRNNADKP